MRATAAFLIGTGITAFLLTVLVGFAEIAAMQIGVIQMGPPHPVLWVGLAVAVWSLIPGFALQFILD